MGRGRSSSSSSRSFFSSLSPTRSSSPSNSFLSTSSSNASSSKQLTKDEIKEEFYKFMRKPEERYNWSIIEEQSSIKLQSSLSDLKKEYVKLINSLSRSSEKEKWIDKLNILSKNIKKYVDNIDNKNESINVLSKIQDEIVSLLIFEIELENEIPRVPPHINVKNVIDIDNRIQDTISELKGI